MFAKSSHSLSMPDMDWILFHWWYFHVIIIFGFFVLSFVDPSSMSSGEIKHFVLFMSRSTTFFHIITWVDIASSAHWPANFSQLIYILLFWSIPRSGFAMHQVLHQVTCRLEGLQLLQRWVHRLSHHPQPNADQTVTLSQTPLATPSAAPSATSSATPTVHRSDAPSFQPSLPHSLRGADQFSHSTMPTRTLCTHSRTLLWAVSDKELSRGNIVRICNYFCGLEVVCGCT